MGLILGIDTSNYTTSLALMDREGKLISDLRTLIQVPPGQKGIQQSKALFAHLKNLPQLMEELPPGLVEELLAISVSTRPRPLPESYLPVFLAGEELGRCLATLLQVRYYATSHQEGHIMALLWALHLSLNTFLAAHFSGGTTEILLVHQDGPLLNIQTLSQSLDLYAGQLVDRIGVRLGLPFPAGPALEKLAFESSGEVYPLPVAIKEGQMSFSGPESAAQRALTAGVPTPALARGVEDVIKETAKSVLQKQIKETGITTILLMGGVFCNQYISSSLTREFREKGVEVYTPPPEYSRDGAVGQAFQGLLFVKDPL